jgi:hypothetical protein
MGGLGWRLFPPTRSFSACREDDSDLQQDPGQGSQQPAYFSAPLPLGFIVIIRTKNKSHTQRKKPKDNFPSSIPFLVVQEMGHNESET